MNIWRILRTRLFIMRAAGDVLFPAVTVLSSIDKKLRFRDFELVKKELQFFLDHRVPQVKFVDRTFNCKHEHAMTIWKYILEHDNGVDEFSF